MQLTSCKYGPEDGSSAPLSSGLIIYSFTFILKREQTSILVLHWQWTCAWGSVSQFWYLIGFANFWVGKYGDCSVLDVYA